MASKNKSEKKQHIQVFTRVRPLSAQEYRSQIIVECISTREVSVRDKTQTKTFTFDRVFGPDSKQVDVYKAVVSPLIAEVLQGYNCTVFAYGQTGTGKTYTMVGEKSDSLNKSWEDEPNCGVIPRTLSHLFDELKVRADEFTVRVSFLELYNEELCDLLAPNDNDDGKNLKLFEDSMKKGSVIVSGLEERTVHNKDDVYAILEAGNLRRQTAPTLMNAQSSRSHTIFTITVHIKVTTPEGEDLIKTGKLNLVDLAGSENIGRSGAVEMRAREAGSINQSLLTLGRVITSLVERTPHVPYRESKLTRILQDSLGGRTKTSIIATVSPALCNIEETLSTFDYAHRARNITNKPEINQKTSKRVLLKEYTEEIERLRRDLIATREKHGVYLASENYNAIMAERENLNKELIAKLQLLKVREDELAKQEEILKSLNMDLYATQNELAVTSQKLEEAKKLCTEKEDMLYKLGQQTTAILKTADEAVSDAKNLHDRLDRSRRILEQNFNSAEKFRNKYCWYLGDMNTRNKNFLAQGIQEIELQKEAEKKFASLIIGQTTLCELTNKFVRETNNRLQSTMQAVTTQTSSNQTFLNEQLMALKCAISDENQVAQKIVDNLMDYLLNMKSQWNKLNVDFENNKVLITKQQSDIEIVKNKLTEMTDMALALPALFKENLKHREKALKLYAEKCKFLEKKQSTLRKQISDFGHSVYKMAQDHVQVLQRESECEEALRNVRSSQSCEEESQFQQIFSTLEQNMRDLAVQAENTEKINETVADSTSKLMHATNDIIPLLNEMITAENQSVNSIVTSIRENSSALVNRLNIIKGESENEKEKMKEFSGNIEKCSSEFTKAVKGFESLVEEKTNQNVIFIEKTLQDISKKKQLFTTQLQGHMNEMISNIDDRMNEIDIFFSENLKKDERTGNTPQRKEFNYPRHILGFSNRNWENSKLMSEESTEISDTDDLNEDKENYANL